MLTITKAVEVIAPWTIAMAVVVWHHQVSAQLLRDVQEELEEQRNATRVWMERCKKNENCGALL
jgi:hypothetical protein